jgi:tetratricopeptide (TPR) repeat protein
MRMLLRISAVVGLALTLQLAGCSRAADRQLHYRERGAELLAAKNYAKARVELANALQINPQDADARYLAAQTAEALGDGAAALFNYNSAILLRPTMTRARARLARLYILVRSPEKAMDLVQAGLHLAPEDPELIAMRGAAHLQLGDPSGALTDALDAATRAPDDDFVIALLCSIYRQEGHVDQALSTARQGVARLPDNAGLRVILAELLADAGHPEQAEQQLKQLIALEPHVLADRINLMQFYLHQQRLDDAEATLRSSVSAIPESAEAKLQLVRFLGAQRDLEQALALARTFATSGADDDDLQIGLGNYYEQLGRASTAEERYQAVASHPHTKAAEYTVKARLAALRFAAGDAPGAVKILGEVLDDSPQNAEALEMRARIAMWRGDAAGAMADLRLLLRDQPANTQIMRALASAHMLNNEAPLAEDMLRGALRLDPSDITTRTELLRLLATTGKSDEALALAQQLLSERRGDAEAVAQVFDLQVARKDFAGARATALKAQQEQPGAMGAYLLGVLGEAEDHPAAALIAYEQALKAQPDFAPPLAAAVRLEVADHQPARALTLLTAVIARNPQHVVAHNLQGEVLLTEGQPAPAIREFETAIRLQPSWWLPYRDLADAQVRQHQLPTALTTLRGGVAASGGSAELALDLSALYEQLGRIDDAIQVCEDLIAREPRALAGVSNLAMLLVTYRQDPVSLLRAQQLAAQLATSTEPSALGTRGWVAFKAGAFAQAIDLLQRAVKQVPSSAVLHYHLGMAQWKAGDASSARHNLELAVGSGEQFLGIDDARAAIAQLRVAPPRTG